MAFCVRLNEDFGARQQRFPTMLQVLGCGMPGYRILSENDWKSIRDALGGSGYLGDRAELGMHFTSNYMNAELGEHQHVGSYLPDHLGFFDLYGNAFELCWGTVEKTGQPDSNLPPSKVMRFKVAGGDVRQRPIIYNKETGESNAALSGIQAGIPACIALA